VNTVIGRDGSRPRKKKKTSRAASKTISAVSGTPSTTNYMQPIQVPTPPTLVSRLSIRSQADLQEQLRIKQTTEREQQKLYAPQLPAPPSFKRQLSEEELLQREFTEEEDLPRMPMMRKEELTRPPSPPILSNPPSLASVSEEESTDFFKRAKELCPASRRRLAPQSSVGQAAEEEFTGFFTQPEERADSPPAPPKRRGRPASDFKTILTLRKEIRAKVSPPPKNLDKMPKDELQAAAKQLGIDIMK